MVEGGSGVEVYEVSYQRTSLLKESKVDKISGGQTKGGVASKSAGLAGCYYTTQVLLANIGYT